MTRANVTLLLFSSPVPKKSSALSSMGLLIARAVGQAPAIKVASKGFFQLPQKWRQKRPTEIKRLERSLLRTFKPGPIFAQTPSFTHLLRLSTLLPTHLILFFSFSFSSKLSPLDKRPFASTKYLSVFTILMQSLPLSLIMRKSRGDLWEPEKLDFGIF